MLLNMKQKIVIIQKLTMAEHSISVQKKINSRGQSGGASDKDGQKGGGWRWR